MNFIGWVMSAGLAAAATGAMAQPLPREIGPPVVTTVSDIEEPYVDLPPPPPRIRRYVPEASYVPEVLSPREIADLARDAGFEPLGPPHQRGLVYTLAALNPDGDDGRLVVDARSGRVLRFMPAWQMGDAMETVTIASYGRIQGLPRFIEHNPPRPPRSVGRLASRTPPTNPPLPRPSPQQSTKGPSPAAAGHAATAVAPVKDATRPATDAAKTDKPDAAPKQEAAVAQDKPAAAPAPAPVAAKPAPAGPAPTIQPTEAMPPVQGLE